MGYLPGSDPTYPDTKGEGRKCKEGHHVGNWAVKERPRSRPQQQLEHRVPPSVPFDVDSIKPEHERPSDMYTYGLPSPYLLETIPKQTLWSFSISGINGLAQLTCTFRALSPIFLPTSSRLAVEGNRD